MKKDSILNSKTGIMFGPSTPIHSTQTYNPDTKEKVTSEMNIGEVKTEQEKEDDDFKYIKSIVRKYETYGRSQILGKSKEILTNFRIANGVLEKEDFIKVEEEHGTELNVNCNTSEDEDLHLESFPIIPNIINSLVNHLSLTKNKYNIFAVNREAQAEIIERKTEELRDNLVGSIMNVFQQQLAAQGITPETQPDVYAEQMKLVQSMPKIEDAYKKDFKFELEKWADIKMINSRYKLKFPQKEKEFFRNKLVCDEPYFHLELQGDKVLPEVLKPENVFYIRSPENEDVCFSKVVGWYSYVNANDIISRYPNMSQELTDKLYRMNMHTDMTDWDGTRYELDVPGELVSAHNYRHFRNLRAQQHRQRHNEAQHELIEKLTMYFQVPRRLNVLYMASGGEVTSLMVDDEYKVTYKPEYKKGKPKAPENLLNGEHLESYFINECWKAVRLNLGSVNYLDETDNDKELWLELEKYPVQLSDPKISKYGSIIPVFGGPTTNTYSRKNSIVDRTKSWEIFHQYLWNRNKQILETELGVFFLMNQTAIPKESMGESWGKDNIIKWALVARDIGIAPIDTSISNTGQAQAASQGFGQKVDMTRIEEVLQKAQLAEICKKECLAAVGLPAQMLNEIVPTKDPNSIITQSKASVSQLFNLYDEHYNTMERVYQAYLELEKYLSIRDESVEEMFINDQSERVAVKFLTEEFPLYQLGIYVVSDYQESLLLSDIKNLVLNDNTMGADLLEKVSALDSHSVIDIHEKLKNIHATKERQVKEQREFEDSQQQKLIESEEKKLQMTLQETARQKDIQRQHELDLAEIKVVGQANFGEGTGFDELMALRESQMRQESLYRDSVYKSLERKDKAALEENKQVLDKEKLVTANQLAQAKLDLEKEKLNVQKADILAKLQQKEIEFKIAKENKP